MLPVMNMQRAQEFYERKLGLKAQGTQPDGNYLFSCGGGTALELQLNPGGTKAEHTAASFEVDNIESEVRMLESQGVVFEDYDMPNLKTANHIGMVGGDKAAWFKDSEGNYLCIHQHLH
jgi:catechol 2,3-dioxygenase-like lactoylglutathione lyase family enzyme